MVKITIPGRPVPAVRMTQRGKYVKGRAQKYLNYKDKVGWVAKAAGIKPIHGQVCINITIYLSGGVHGDWDNYGKAICDGLNGIAYDDDRQIIDARVRKVLGVRQDEERVEVEIWEVGVNEKEQNSGI